MKVRVSTAWGVEACWRVLFLRGCAPLHRAETSSARHEELHTSEIGEPWREKLGHLLSQPSPTTGHGWARSVLPANPGRERRVNQSYRTILLHLPTRRRSEK